LIDCIVQEIDLVSGSVWFEWHAVDHIGLDESEVAPAFDDPTEPAFDFVHYNSMAEDSDRNIILSGRNSWAIYKIDRVTGEVIWRLGGKKGDFEQGDGTTTAFQHDARPQEGKSFSIFDNGADPVVHKQSRGIVLTVDQDAKTVQLDREYLHPDGISAGSQGNMQLLPNGNVMIGWGNQPRATEFAADGTVLLDLAMPEGRESYRAYRFEWQAKPTEAPALAIERAGKETSVYASWNGATDVSAWQLVGGPGKTQLAPIGGRVARIGFETVIMTTEEVEWVAMQALDVSGAVLGASPTRKVPAS
jgi:Arylsulfotransferase (ASST)